MTPVCLFDAEKITEAVLPYVSTIAFPASFLGRRHFWICDDDTFERYTLYTNTTKTVPCPPQVIESHVTPQIFEAGLEDHGIPSETREVQQFLDHMTVDR